VITEKIEKGLPYFFSILPAIMSSTVTFHEKVYTFTLWRDDKKVVHEFKNVSTLGIHGVDERIALPEDRAKIDGPSCEGVFYYIYAEHYDGEYSMMWLSKDEADVLTPMLDAIKDDRYYKDFECEFTRATINDCIKNPANYGPEMRARIMMASCPKCHEGLAGSVYRPRCSVCPWDSDKD
jgi:hypothetical protein